MSTPFSAAMALAMSQLHHIAAHADVALLLVDHQRKSARMAMDSDPIDDIFGATARAGVVDVALGLYHKHGTPDATLKGHRPRRGGARGGPALGRRALQLGR